MHCTGPYLCEAGSEKANDSTENPRNHCGDLPLGTDRQRSPAVSDTRAFFSEETVEPAEMSATRYSCRPCSLQECRQTPVLFSQKMP